MNQYTIAVDPFVPSATSELLGREVFEAHREDVGGIWNDEDKKGYYAFDAHEHLCSRPEFNVGPRNPVQF